MRLLAASPPPCRARGRPRRVDARDAFFPSADDDDAVTCLACATIFAFARATPVHANDPRPLSGIVRRRPSRPLSFLTRLLPLLPVPPPEPTSVTSASSGREAIDLLERGSRFNLLLTDVMMPDVDGPALLHHVRNNEEYREMPVVMMSSNEHADIVLNCIRLGAEDYLLKPVSKKAVKHMWAHVWRRKQRFQMVPSLENQTREAEEEERFDQQMAAGNLVVDHEDIDGALPVPSTEEYSSDGGSDEEMEDETTQADEARAGPGSRRASSRAQRYAAEFVDGASDPDAPTQVLPERGEGLADGDRAPFVPGLPPPSSAFPIATVEEGAAGEEERAAGLEDEEDLRDEFSARVESPMTAPIAGLASGKTTVREWIDEANAAGRRLEMRDALHVLGGAARLLASQHERGMLLGATRPSALAASPHGDVTLAPPRPATPPGVSSLASPGGGGGGGGGGGAYFGVHGAADRNRSRRDSCASGDVDADSGDDDSATSRSDDSASSASGSDSDAEDARDAGGSQGLGGESGIHRSAREERSEGLRRRSEGQVPTMGSSGGSDGVFLSDGIRAEALYDAAPEEALSSARAGGLEGRGSAPVPAPGGGEFEFDRGAASASGAASVSSSSFGGAAAAECFALGVMMVEMCWPAVVKGARGDVGRLLRATLRADGAGAAELGRDPRESAVARALLHPTPRNRPTAAKAAELLADLARAREAEREAEEGYKGGGEAAAEESGATRSRRGLLTSTPRERDVAAERRRAELVALAGFLRAHKRARAREVQAHRVRSALIAHALRQLGGEGFAERGTSGAEPTEPRGTEATTARGTSPKKGGRASLGPASFARRGASMDLGPRPDPFAPPGEKPPKRVKTDAGSRPGSLDEPKSPKSPKSPQIPQSPQIPKTQGPPGQLARPLSLAGKSFSEKDLALLDANNVSARRAALSGHRPAAELNEGALESLEEHFFDSCARAVAPVASAFAAARADADAIEQGEKGSSSRAREGDAVELDEGRVATVDGSGSALDVDAQRDARERAASLARRRASAEAASAASAALSGALVSFGGDLAQCMRRTYLRVRADVSPGDVHSFGEMISSTGWDRDGEYVAAAGISKRVRVYEVAAMTDLGAAVQCPVAEMRTRAKISSLTWNPYMKSVLASADYDGVIDVWDASRGVAVSDAGASRGGHKKRVWSLSFSRIDPTLLASGGDDGAVKLWSLSQRECVGTIQRRANVCSVQFSPDSAHVLAYGAVDGKIYVHDQRHLARPLATLAGHRKAVSYVRWMGADRIVSSSTDNTLRLWDVKRSMMAERDGFGASEGNLFGESSSGACSRVFAGHANQKNFVGLSVAPDGHIACGSEDNSVCLYARCVPTPIARQSLAATARAFGSANEAGAGEKKPGLFATSVSWAPGGGRLVAANSCGAVKILEIAHDDK